MNPKPKPIKIQKPKKKPRKKTTRQLLERQLDAIVKEIVLERDGFCVCFPPKNGHSSIRQPGHLISRSKKSIRWDLRNVNEQCSSCNMRHVHMPEIYTNWFVSTFGSDIYDCLVTDSMEIRKHSVFELEKMLNELKAIRDFLPSFELKPRFSQSEILSGEWRKNVVIYRNPS